jgi:hypothetical protein
VINPPKACFCKLRNPPQLPVLSISGMKKGRMAYGLTFRFSHSKRNELGVEINERFGDIALFLRSTRYMCSLMGAARIPTRSVRCTRAWNSKPDGRTLDIASRIEMIFDLREPHYTFLSHSSSNSSKAVGRASGSIVKHRRMKAAAGAISALSTR